VRLEAEGDERHEAEGEPLPALHGAGGVVAAVLALEGLRFGAFEGGGEGCGKLIRLVVVRGGEGRTVCAAGEEEEHCCGGFAATTRGVGGWVVDVAGGSVCGRGMELGAG
jgi:hypothetical protein